MKSKTQRFGLVFCAGLAAASFAALYKLKEPAPPASVPLLFNLRSGQSPSQVKLALSSSRANISVLNSYGLPSSGTRKRYSELVLSASPIHYAGTPGTLSLSFYNGKLLETTFFANANMSTTKMVVDGINVSQNSQKEDYPRRVEVRIDDSGHPVISISDTYLENLQNQWIREHA